MNSILRNIATAVAVAVTGLGSYWSGRLSCDAASPLVWPRVSSMFPQHVLQMLDSYLLLLVTLLAVGWGLKLIVNSALGRDWNGWQ